MKINRSKDPVFNELHRKRMMRHRKRFQFGSSIFIGMLIGLVIGNLIKNAGFGVITGTTIGFIIGAYLRLRK
ncbi:MAG: hypothetical protein ABIM99_04515 [Candidatus Dojkabacteria bacterium]